MISNYKQGLGAVLMGLGWGISGLEFTGYFIHSAIFTISTVIVYGAFLIFGSMICDIL